MPVDIGTLYQIGYGRGSNLLNLSKGIESGLDTVNKIEQMSFLRKQQERQARQEDIANKINLAKLELTVATDPNSPRGTRVSSYNNYRQLLSDVGVKTPGGPVTEDLLKDNEKIIDTFGNKSLEVLNNIKSPGQYATARATLEGLYSDAVSDIGASDKNTLSNIDALKKSRMEYLKSKALTDVYRSPERGSVVIPGTRGPGGTPNMPLTQDQAIKGALAVGATGKEISDLLPDEQKQLNATQLKANLVKKKLDEGVITEDEAIQLLGSKGVKITQGSDGSWSVEVGGTGSSSGKGEVTKPMQTQIQKEMYGAKRQIQEIDRITKSGKIEDISGLWNRLSVWGGKWASFISHGYVTADKAAEDRDFNSMMKVMRIKFRKDNTGVAFNPIEAEEYEEIFPDLSEDGPDLVKAKLRAMKNLSQRVIDQGKKFLSGTDLLEALHEEIATETKYMTWDQIKKAFDSGELTREEAKRRMKELEEQGGR